MATWSTASAGSMAPERTGSDPVRPGPARRVGAPRDGGVASRAVHDIVIRGGTVVDGSGGAPVVADVAIDGDRIAAVGAEVGSGRREVAAEGLVVTPGWVDMHT